MDEKTDAELEKQIRDSIASGIFGRMLVTSPQFDRLDGKVIKIHPKNSNEFDNLKKAPDKVLKLMGLQIWEKGHWLFPAEWYDHIPNGYMVTAINGQDEPFEHGKTDDDRRFGALSYGFKKA